MLFYVAPQATLLRKNWHYIWRGLCALLVVYVCTSVLFTTSVLFSPLVRSAIEQIPGRHRHSTYSTFFDDYLSLFDGIFKFGSILFRKSNSQMPSGVAFTSALGNLTFFGNRSGDVIFWDSSIVSPSGMSSRVFGRRSTNSDTSMKASLFLSKVFATSQEYLAYDGQSSLDMIPYYYRASAVYDADDITITTLVTRNRFSAFKRLVERYRGPISVTVHVSLEELEDDRKRMDGNFLSTLHSLYASSPLMSRFVDMHIVLTPAVGDRQFNAWRNVARLFARTDYVMMLDVDFVPCTNFRSRIRSLRNVSVKTMLQNGEAALVIPAFEYVKEEEGRDANTFPKSKQELVALYNASRIAMFHASWAPGHNSTNYKRFLFRSQPGEVYKVESSQYQYSYEPYLVFRRSGPEPDVGGNKGPGVPWCDERFVGYGGNKAACVYEMHLAGVALYVLADDFLVHQSHAYDESARRRERRYNRRVYADFREEACLRYLLAFRNAGILDSQRAHNAREECKKIKTIARNFPKLLGGK